MKKIILTICCFGCLAAYAQDGFYLAPAVGTGKASIDSKLISSGPLSIPANYFQAGIGYKAGQWKWESGLRYATSGYKYTEPEYEINKFDPAIFIPDINYTVKYDHLEVPIEIGYEIKLTKRFSIVPTIGIIGSYNLNSSTTTGIPDFYTKKKRLTRQEFNQRYERFSLWALAGIDATYKLTDRINAVVGVQADRMINSFTTSYRPIPNQHNNIFLFNFGVQWRIKANKKDPQPSAQ